MVTLPSYTYQLYGLTLLSEVALSDLPTIDAAANSSADSFVELVRGPAPERLADAQDFGWIDANSEHCIFHFKDRCRIQVTGGKRIVFDQLGPLTESEISAYISACSFPAIAYMRGMLPFHVSVVSTPNGELMFTGASGAGKSTIGAILGREPGNQLLCDDIAVVDQATERIYFGHHKIKLWDDALAQLGILSSDLEPDLIRVGKYHLKTAVVGSSLLGNLSRIVVLEWGAAVAWQELSKARLFATFLNALHAPFLATVYWELAALQHAAKELAEQVDGFTWTRPRGVYSRAEVVSFITDKIKK